MAVEFNLQDGETVLKEVSGDYWKKGFFLTYSQKTGRYCFTSQRILFKGGLTEELNLPYSEISEVKTCNVGPLIPFLPTGVKVTMRDGKEYKLSLLSRKKYVEMIQSQIG